MKKVAFICVHNSCRSQIAEALGRHFACDVFESYSAGTETKSQINQDAVRIMKKLYGIDMEKTQYSKLISDIPEPDIAISMGRNVCCPYIGRPFDDNWELEDPTGKSDEEFKKVILQIERNILMLKQRVCDEFQFDAASIGVRKFNDYSHFVNITFFFQEVVAKVTASFLLVGDCGKGRHILRVDV